MSSRKSKSALAYLRRALPVSNRGIFGPQNRGHRLPFHVTLGLPLGPQITGEAAELRVSSEPRRLRLVVVGVENSDLLRDPGLDVDMDRVRRSGTRIGVELTVRPDSCLYADDVLRWCEVTGITDVTFFAGPEFITAGAGARAAVTPELRFHTAMFFERLSRMKSFDWRMRLYYRRLANRVDAGAVDLVADAGPVGPSLSETISFGARVVSGRTKNLRRQPATAFERVAAQPAEESELRAWRHVIITGWYGTETHGDKAILGELLHFLHLHAPACRVTVTTLHKGVSEQSVRELPSLAGCNLIEFKRCAEPAVIESADAVIIGGGPLNESTALLELWKIFAEANRQRKARVIFGCGIGPVHTQQFCDVIASIIELATAGFLRDAESHAYATAVCPGHVLKYACDPAIAFVDRWRRVSGSLSNAGEPRRIAGLLRANTNEFQAGQAVVTLDETNRRTARQLAELVSPVCDQNNTVFELLHMNAHWLGGDDRLMNRWVEASFKDPSLVRAVRRYNPLELHLRSLASADVAVAMRYHGHIFSMALGIPFLSVDYTGRAGKVSSFMKQIGCEGLSQPWDEVDVVAGTALLQQLIAERERLSRYLLEQTARLVDDLECVYKDVFELDQGASSHLVATLSGRSTLNEGKQWPQSKTS